MNIAFLLLALVVAGLEWLAEEKRQLWLIYITKPAVMVLVLLWLWSVNGFQGDILWFTMGIAFSLAGDILLMLPQDRFIPGLVAFLLAHLCYLTGFLQVAPPLNLASLILTLMVILLALRLYRRITNGMASDPKKSRLKRPILVYSIVISLMLLSAFLTLARPEWQAAPALLVSGGAVLFYLSDTLNAWLRFVAAFPHGRLTIMSTYHLGQFLIVFGAVLHYQ